MVLPLFFCPEMASERFAVNCIKTVFSKNSCFYLHNALFYFKIVLKVVESGTKWLEVVDFTPLKADRGRHFMAGDR